MKNVVGLFCDEGIFLGMILWVGQGIWACRSNLSIVISRLNLSIETSIRIHTATRHVENALTCSMLLVYVVFGSMWMHSCRRVCAVEVLLLAL